MKSLKKWANQFTEKEWGQLCANKDFNDILLEDAELAMDVAETILNKKINKPY